MESLKQKEEISKDIYNEWSKKLVSNTYNKVQLESDNELHTLGITDSETQIIKLNEDLKGFETNLKTLEAKRDELNASRRITISNQELIRTNPVLLKREIDDAKVKQNPTKEQGKLIIVTEPSKFYNEDDHSKLTAQINDTSLTKRLNEDAIKRQETLVHRTGTGTICPTCEKAVGRC